MAARPSLRAPGSRLAVGHARHAAAPRRAATGARGAGRTRRGALERGGARAAAAIGAPPPLAASRSMVRFYLMKLELL